MFKLYGFSSHISYRVTPYIFLRIYYFFYKNIKKNKVIKLLNFKIMIA